MSKQQNNLSQGYVSIKAVVALLSALIILVTLLLAYRSAQIQTRDAQRLADIARIQAALKLFKDYNLYYPTSVGNQPKDIVGYLEYWPKAPSADGSCTDQSNQYVYEQIDGGESYALSFCLGSGVGNFDSGQYRIGP